VISPLSVASALFAASAQAQTPSGADPVAQAAATQEGSFGQVGGQMGTLIQGIEAAKVRAVTRMHIAMRNVAESLMKMDHVMHTRAEDPPPNIASANQTTD